MNMYFIFHNIWNRKSHITSGASSTLHANAGLSLESCPRKHIFLQCSRWLHRTFCPMGHWHSLFCRETFHNGALQSNRQVILVLLGIGWADWKMKVDEKTFELPTAFDFALRYPTYSKSDRQHIIIQGFHLYRKNVSRKEHLQFLYVQMMSIWTCSTTPVRFGYHFHITCPKPQTISIKLDGRYKQSKMWVHRPSLSFNSFQLFMLSIQKWFRNRLAAGILVRM